MSDAYDVPLLEVLDSVPLNGRSMWEVSTHEHRNIPYGNICQQAAMRIRQLERELAEMTQFRDLLANKEIELLKQLTAHKAALEKCETYITKHSQPIGGFHKGGRYFELDDSIQLQAEALQEIAKLKNPNEPLDSIPTHRLPNSGIR